MRQITVIRAIVLLSLPFGESRRGVAQTPGEWTWMHGNNVAGSTGVYGIQGVASAGNTPPAVYEPCEWRDNNGNFWFFGGENTGSNIYSALWKYDPDPTSPTYNQWTWMKGPLASNQPGVYGTQGTSSTANYPGSRSYGAVTWVDASGNLWLFGGSGYSASGGLGRLNDLWKYTIATNEWTWMNGSNTINNPGSYGVQVVASPANLPPSRDEIACSWTNNAGNLWLYGGMAGGGSYGDLWKYDIAANEWTWMNGANIFNTTAVYGIQGVASSANAPGGKWAYCSWADLAGKLWLFGGNSSGGRNDLWKYDPDPASATYNQWTWMKGSGVANDPGNYGTRCVSTNTNMPPARTENRARVRDACGNFWHFGGSTNGMFNDLWHYNVSTNQWTWVSGSNVKNQAAVFGTKGTSGPAVKPGGKNGNVAWIDTKGYIWIFGGMGTGGRTNDLFRYVPDTACISVSAVSVGVSFNTTICIGQSATLTTSGATSYIWSPGGYTTSAIVVSPITTSTYTVIGNNICGSDTSSVTVTVAFPPAVAITGNDTICAGDNVVLTASGGGNYLWNTGQTDVSIIVNPPATTTYTTVVSIGTCSATASYAVAVKPIPVANAWSNVSIIAGNNATLNSSSNPSSVTYNWSPATGLSCITCQNPVAVPPVTTEYCVTVTDINNCTDTACVIVTVVPELPIDCSNTGELYLPNAFSPNNDGENDVLQLYHADPRCIKSIRLTLYNRWGEKVFETTDIRIGWDGKYRGNIQNTAVFNYYLEAAFITGGTIAKKGNISLVK